MLTARRTARPLGVALLGAIIAALLGAAVARSGILVGALPIAAFAVCAFVLRRPLNGLLAAVAVVALIPVSYGKGGVTVIQLACGLAFAGLMMSCLLEGARLRLTAVDFAVAGLLVAAGIDWWLRNENFTAARATVTTVMPLIFYFAARVAVPRAATRTVLLTLIGAATLASFTVFYEFARGTTVFQNPDSYYWVAQTGHGIFRPGGVFGSPPTAVTILSMVTLAGFPLLREAVGRQKRLLGTCFALMIAAGLLTFTRAGWIGFGAGLLTYLLLLWLPGGLGLPRWLWAVPVVAIAVVLALPALKQTNWFQLGVERTGTLAVRESYWRQAIPLITGTPKHLFFGYGLNSLVAGTRGGIGALQTAFAETPDLIAQGAHNQYVRTLLEQGAVGLLLVVWWFAGALARAVRAIPHVDVRDRRLVAGLAGSVASFLVVSLAGTSFRDVNSFAIISLLTGLLVSLSTPDRARQS